jgi:hypothetical protein
MGLLVVFILMDSHRLRIFLLKAFTARFRLPTPEYLNIRTTSMVAPGLYTIRTNP